MLSHGYGDDNPNNRWMERVTKFVLEEMRPKVYWGENAPGFAGKVGTPVRERLRQTGKENGYTMTVYRTKSALHGLGQVRERSFYFFWDQKHFDGTPLLDYYDVPRQRIEETILGATGNTQREPLNPKTPSASDPIYRRVLEKAGMTHREFARAMVDASKDENYPSLGRDVQHHLQFAMGETPAETAAWLAAHGYEREAKAFQRRATKLDEGLNVMYRRTIVPAGIIGAFVNPSQLSITHPVEDRYIDAREAMTIMGLPQDFELLDPKHCHNHVCQNVPVRTAQDMAVEVLRSLEGERQLLRGAPVVFQTHRVEGAPTTSLEAFFG
jgi:site-specific DNA-cytosine methylase